MMFLLRCLSLLLVLGAVFIRCEDDEATETLIEMKGDKLNHEETMESASTTENYLLRNVNRDYDKLGKIYVAEYYSRFDDPSKRLSLVALYHHEDSFMTFEGDNFRGTKRILEKFEKLNLVNVQRSIKTVDVQPFLDGGVIVNVIGKVRADNEPLKLYAQTFVFKPQKGSFFLQHDIFRVIRDD